MTIAMTDPTAKSSAAHVSHTVGTQAAGSIAQLKQIRAEAIARLRNSHDFKLAGRLGALIVELGDTLDDTSELAALEDAKIPRDPVMPFASKPNPFAPKPVAPVTPLVGTSTGGASKTDETEETEILDELVAEIKNDMADLDRTSLGASAVPEPKTATTVKPFMGRASDNASDAGASKMTG
ncbi:MAG: hypothetical protein AAF035_13475 [Pseudomonadota bacterium]